MPGQHGIQRAVLQIRHRRRDRDDRHLARYGIIGVLNGDVPLPVFEIRLISAIGVFRLAAGRKQDFPGARVN